MHLFIINEKKKASKERIFVITVRLLLIYQRKAIRHYNYIRGDTSCKKEHLNQKTKII